MRMPQPGQIDFHKFEIKSADDILQFLFKRYGDGDMMAGTKAKLAPVVARVKPRGFKSTLWDMAQPGDMLVLYATVPDKKGRWQLHVVSFAQRPEIVQ